MPPPFALLQDDNLHLFTMRLRVAGQNLSRDFASSPPDVQMVLRVMAVECHTTHLLRASDLDGCERF